MLALVFCFVLSNNIESEYKPSPAPQAFRVSQSIEGSDLMKLRYKRLMQILSGVPTIYGIA